MGKELGAYHVLATVGYEFPAASWNTTTNAFNANVHLDRQCFGWVYPLVEVNWTYHTKKARMSICRRNAGSSTTGITPCAGNLVMLAVGATLVLVQDRVEVGAVYTTPLATHARVRFQRPSGQDGVSILR